MFKRTAAFALFFVTSQFALAHTLEFSKGMSVRDIQSIKRDLSSDLSLEDDSQLKQLLQVKDLSSRSLKNWLYARLRYVMSDQETVTDKVVHLGFHHYDNQDLPAEFLVTPPVRTDLRQSNNLVIGENVGTDLYYLGKTSGELVGFNFPTAHGSELVKITSPRVGLIRLRADFYNVPDKQNLNSMANKWYQLAILFQMARHSDGNGPTLGFPHGLCPSGHFYANLNACDNENNGPSAIAARLLIQALRTCEDNKSCTPHDSEILKIEAAENLDRVIGKTAADARAEGRL